VHDYKPYSAFVQKLVELDDIMGDIPWSGFHQYYHKRDWPAKYLTNCEGAHPTLEGYKVIGSELADFIKSRGYV
jgi:lysophospholipase L1-like esterase